MRSIECFTIIAVFAIVLGGINFYHHQTIEAARQGIVLEYCNILKGGQP